MAWSRKVKKAEDEEVWSRILYMMAVKTEGQGSWGQGNLSKVVDHQVWSRLKVNKPEKKEVRSRFPSKKVDEGWRLMLPTRKSDQGRRQRNLSKVDEQKSDQDWTRTLKADKACCSKQGHEEVVWWTLMSKSAAKVPFMLPDNTGKHNSLNEYGRCLPMINAPVDNKEGCSRWRSKGKEA